MAPARARRSVPVDASGDGEIQISGPCDGGLHFALFSAGFGLEDEWLAATCSTEVELTGGPPTARRQRRRLCRRGVFPSPSASEASLSARVALAMTEDWINVADAEGEGLERLERGPRDYFAGGAGDEVTLRENVEAWGHWRLRPRVLNDVREVTTAAEVLGKPVDLPVLVAPVAYQRMAHPEAERGMAAGTAEAGTVMCLSTLSTTRPAEVAAAAPDGRNWFQLYAFKDE